VTAPQGAAARRPRNPKGAGGRLRQDLLVAAGRLLDDGGDAALTMRAVAREVGAAPQSVYLHFADREQLLWAVLSERFREFGGELDAATETCDPGDPTGRLRARCRCYCAFGLQHPRRYRLLLDRQAPVHLALPADAFPGAIVLNGFVDGISPILSCDDQTPPTHELFAAATDLLATLHGAVLFRTSLPSFPWPPIESVIEHALTNLTAGRRNTPTQQPSTAPTSSSITLERASE
jgi:AcrR family transcriptional regulator